MRTYTGYCSARPGWLWVASLVLSAQFLTGCIDSQQATEPETPQATEPDKPLEVSGTWTFSTLRVENSVMTCSWHGYILTLQQSGAVISGLLRSAGSNFVECDGKPFIPAGTQLPDGPFGTVAGTLTGRRLRFTVSSGSDNWTLEGDAGDNAINGSVTLRESARTFTGIFALRK